ncbi:MAG: carbohydrate binding family 9 domain-containing protein, partial [Bacteroidia bacterium]|nr:carbohydrate binding family 9 domain-containing protein [Bacteroidia bacterium]
MKKVNTIATFLCLLASLTSFGQKPIPSLNISRAVGEIKIDGELNETAWKNCEIAKDFYQSVPVDTAFANTKTEVRVTYDDKYLYISAICYDTINKPYIVQSLKRDFSYPVSDAFGVYIDPYDDHTNGFSFAVNPRGVQREGLIQVGGNYGVTTAWDILWLSEVKNYSDRWVVEIAIPFTSLRFNKGSKKWRINFSRNDLKRNEGSSWASVPRNFNIASLAFCGELIWDVPFESKKKSIAIIPYLTGGTQKTHLPQEEKRTFSKNLGTDARIGITNSLQLDLTLNPDFSQVEVDRQVTNLSRFNLFFPERRNFFIENSDLFSDFGFRQIRPFFSRKIGLDGGEIIPIVAGARLSGKVGKDWRIGIMNIHTNIAEQRPMQNYSVLALQKRVLKNSTIGVIGLNRNSYNAGKINTNDYNRIIGSDFNFNTIDRKWTGKVFYHHAFTPNQTKDNFTHASYLAYSTKSFFAMWNHEYVGQNFIADFGFVPRLERYNPDLGIRQRNAYWRL